MGVIALIAGFVSRCVP